MIRIYILFAIYFGLSAVSMGQYSLNTFGLTEEYEETTQSWNPTSKSSTHRDELGRVLGSESYQIVEGEWRVYYRSSYAYHGDSEQIEERLTISTQYYSNPVRFVTSIFRYNEAGAFTYLEQYTQEIIDGDTVDVRKLIDKWTYDEYDKLLKKEDIEIFFEETEEFRNQSQIDYTYDGEGCLTGSTRSIITDAGVQIITQKTVYINNADCQPIEFESEIIGQGPLEKRIYSYEGTQLVEEIDYRFESTLNDWIPSEKQSFVYSGDTTFVLQIFWNDQDMKWNPETLSIRGSIPSPNGTIQVMSENNYGSSISTRIHVVDEDFRTVSNTFYRQNENEARFIEYREEFTYDEAGRTLTETRLTNYRVNTENFEQILTMFQTYFETPEQFRSETEMTLKKWDDQTSSYGTTYSTSSLTVDYHCNGLLKSRLFGRNGIPAVRYTYIQDQSAIDECLDGSTPAITVFPNPAYDLLSVRLNGLNRVATTLEILGLDGRLVRRVNLREGDFIEEINLKGLVEGPYILKIDKNGEISHHKFIKLSN